MRAPIGPLTQQSNKVPKNAQTICRICINCWKMESSSNRAQLGDGMMDEDRIRHARPAPTAGASRKRAKLKTIPARPQAGGGREVFFGAGFTSPAESAGFGQKGPPARWEPRNATASRALRRARIWSLPAQKAGPGTDRGRGRGAFHENSVGAAPAAGRRRRPSRCATRR